MAEARPIIHVWITKYALTKGLLETHAEHCIDINPDMIVVVRCNSYCRDYYHKGQWYLTEKEAKSKVRLMILSKIKSLEKSLTNMRALLELYP